MLLHTCHSTSFVPCVGPCHSFSLVNTPAARPVCRRSRSAALAQGFDITPDLRRMCSSLTLQQIYKLTEHHHDDWITGSQTTDTLVLLQTLKRVVDSTVRLTLTITTATLQLSGICITRCMQFSPEA